MKRLWNDGWTFLRTQTGAHPEQILAKKESFQAVDLPHDWLIYDSERLYEDGMGWYRKRFTFQETGKRVFLIFEGIYMDSKVYVNGQKAGEWKYGYSSFDLEITEFLETGDNEVLVSVCFMSPNSRWYSGAGIYRDVWFKTTEKTYIEENGIYVSTAPRGRDFSLYVETAVQGTELQNRDGEGNVPEGRKNIQVAHRLFRDAEEIKMQTVSEQGTLAEYLVEKPELWDVENPVLYTLRTELLVDGKIVQTEVNRIGFRYTEFRPKEGFFLNGRHLRLNGVCEHHDLGALGAAFHRAAMKRKFSILKEMGVNAVRGTHNMMAPGFVELADEMGILMISEAFDMWERPKTDYDYARFFKEWHERDVKSWVCRDRNHPSVIMWSIGNEIYDTHVDEHGQEITGQLKALVETYDPRGNAAVTIGSNYMPWENAQKCADLVKLAGYNYSEKYYEQHHEQHPDWVIYGSETSSIVQSRGVYHFPLKAGILSEDDEQCSALGNSITSWGARSMEDCVTVDRDTPFSMGQFLWTGFDYIGEPTPYHTKNSYFGQIDTAGFPKDSYYVWQSAWTDYRRKPMVHLFPYWDFNPGQLIDVRVCSNAPEVELFLNGESLGRQSLSNGPGSGKKILADYQVPYREGCLYAVAYNEKGEEIARKERRSFGNSFAIVLKPENTVATADGRDLFFVEIGTVDAQGNPVENACDRVRVEVTGKGRLIGLDNGDSTDYDSYKGVSRRLFSGKLLAIIQTNTEPGEIRIRVNAKGLRSAELMLQSVVSAENEAAQYGLSALETNCERKIVTGCSGEIPVRKITLYAENGQCFTPERKELTVRTCLEPAEAEDQEVFFRAVNDGGVPSNLVTVRQEGKKAIMTALGDGSFRLRCMSKSGTPGIRLISQLEFSIEGLGQAYLDPYGFISGSLYTYSRGEAGNGNERGVATARDGETVVSYENIDFGRIGSDEITVPIFALDSNPYPIEIWEGIPGAEGSELLADVVYQKPSVWNVYQEDTWKLNRMVKGITTISFLLRQKVHIKGFSFTRYEKAWTGLSAVDADAIYGDSFQMTEDAVEGIGNNVSFAFQDMDFGEKGTASLRICGRAPKGNNTIHVRFFDGQEESKQIVEFTQSDVYEEQSFAITPVKGKTTVTFVFMPGSCFDFKWFRFEKTGTKPDKM